MVFNATFNNVSYSVEHVDQLYNNIYAIANIVESGIKHQ
jgi:hypothetical protein